MPNTSKLLDGTLAELFDIETAEVSFVPAGANGMPLLSVKGLANEFELPATTSDTGKAEAEPAEQQEADAHSEGADKSDDLLAQLARKMLSSVEQPDHVEITKLLDAASVKISAQALQIRDLKRKLDKAQQRVSISAHVPESLGEQLAKSKPESPFPAYWQNGKAHGLVGRES